MKELLDTIESGLAARYKRQTHWPAFAKRMRQHGPRLLDELAHLYGERADFGQVAEQLLDVAYEGWRERAPDLKRLDTEREAKPDWFASEQMLGGVCYADLHAGDFQGLAGQIPEFKELGLTYLHLMPPYALPAAAQRRRLCGQQLPRHDNRSWAASKTCAASPPQLRKAGISLVLDFVFNHTSDEHEWARAALAGDPTLQRTTTGSSPTATQPDALRAHACARSFPTSILAPSRQLRRRPLGLDHVSTPTSGT